MPAYKLVIFDFDGTLADSAEWMVRSLNQAARKFGFRSVTEEEIHMLRGRSNREIIRYLGVPLWKLPQIAATMRTWISEEAEQIQLFTGAPAMLRALTQVGLQLAIVSSNSEENVRRILGPENAALLSHFACGATMFGKAHKLRAVIARSGVSSAETICIGDETRDIEAAREAGAASGAVLWGYATADVLARFEPTMTFATMEEVAVLARATADPLPV